jgi:hypothetical protein
VNYLTEADDLPIERQPILDTSRLSQVGIEKFIAPDEKINYASKGRFFFGSARDSRYAYVTNKRVLFYDRARALLVFKSDRLDEIYLDHIRGFKLVETGVLVKKVYLALSDADKGSMRIQGQRAEVLDLYRAIQFAITKGPSIQTQTVQVNQQAVPTQVVKEREVVKEIVMLPCGHCGTLLPQTGQFCDNCGAPRRLS